MRQSLHNKIFPAILTLFFTGCQAPGLPDDSNDMDHDGVPNAIDPANPQEGEDWCPRYAGPATNHGCRTMVLGENCQYWARNLAGYYAASDGNGEPFAYPNGFCQPRPPKDFALVYFDDESLKLEYSSTDSSGSLGLQAVWVTVEEGALFQGMAFPSSKLPMSGFTWRNKQGQEGVVTMFRPSSNGVTSAYNNYALLPNDGSLTSITTLVPGDTLKVRLPPPRPTSWQDHGGTTTFRECTAPTSTNLRSCTF